MTSTSSNIIIYGNNNSKAALAIYEKIFQTANSLFPTTNFSIATPKNLLDALNQQSSFVKILPLLLIDGHEYSILKNNLNASKQENYVLLPPLLKNEKILASLFIHASENTIFLAHGSNDSSIQKKYQAIELASKPFGSFNFCYFLGKPYFKDYLTKKLSQNQPIKIKPLMFIDGKHINIDLKENFLVNSNPSKWSVLTNLGRDHIFIENLLKEIL